MPRRTGRTGGPHVRDLDDALDGADEPVDDRATAALYAQTIGRHRAFYDGLNRATTEGLGAPPDTVYDDYEGDAW